ncbi:hypothetical protein ACFVSN_36420 [Kitasatospora sp. NPDC057904]|uniref:hypothetical protein n=1 Tax=Kitasatospora sp. NPDC057904 TaxID=3346275 RepID=UPI0036DCDF52
MGLESMPGVEWKIMDAKGRNYSYDSEEEALEELHEYGPGASVWRREVYRVTIFFTRSVNGWQQVHPVPSA